MVGMWPKQTSCPDMCAQVIGKALPTSGLLNLSGLRLLWVSRKGQLLFKAAAEEPRRRSKASRLKTALQGAAGVGLANSAPPKGPVQGPQGTTTPPASQSPDATTSKDLTVVIDVADGHDSHTTPGEVVLQVGGGSRADVELWFAILTVCC